MAMLYDAGGGSKPKAKASTPWFAQSSQYQAPAAAAITKAKKAAQVLSKTSYTPPTQTNKVASRTTSGGGGRTYDPYAAQRAAAAAAAAKAAAEKAAREKKQNEATKKQVEALKQMIDKSFAQNRDAKLKSIALALTQQDAAVMESYGLKTKGLDRLFDDNEKSEHDATHANLQNRVRERGDILDEALSQGAGETDLLRSQMMAARNWAANQQEVNRSYFDTQTSINNALSELNADTKVERVNLENKANKDKSSIWDTYYGQVTDTWMQIANLEAQNTNDSYKALYPDAAKKGADAAGKAWTDPGVSQGVLDWKGEDGRETTLNNTQEWSMQPRGVTQMKRPEGATLRKW